MNYRKKLIEVALPLEVINTASAREKSIRHGHPSTLYLWWSRKPLATARAVLFASLVDDADNLGSIRVLEKLGMRRVGQEENEMRWELSVIRS